MQCRLALRRRASRHVQATAGDRLQSFAEWVRLCAFTSLLTLSLCVLKWLFLEVHPHYYSSGGALKIAVGDSPEESSSGEIYECMSGHQRTHESGDGIEFKAANFLGVTLA